MLQDWTSACPSVYLIFMHFLAFALRIEVSWPGGSTRAMAVSGVPWEGKGRKEKPHTWLFLIDGSSVESGQVGSGVCIQGCGSHRTVW